MPEINGIKGRILSTEKGGIVRIQIETEDRSLSKPFFTKYFQDAVKKAKGDKSLDKYLRALVFSFAYYYKKRTLKQNALYHALLAILGYEVFGEFHHEDEIHEEILAIYSPRVPGSLTKRMVPKRSKDLTTYEFAILIEGVFKELAEHGVSIDAGVRIAEYWREWATWRGTVGDPLKGSYKSVEEYKARIPYCEACLKYLGHGGGHIAHIISKGAGGKLEDTNIFHLCETCHTGFENDSGILEFDKIQSQHLEGWEAFLKRFPHLRWKYVKAHERYGLTSISIPTQKQLEENDEGEGNESRNP